MTSSPACEASVRIRLGQTPPNTSTPPLRDVAARYGKIFAPVASQPQRQQAAPTAVTSRFMVLFHVARVRCVERLQARTVPSFHAQSVMPPALLCGVLT